MEVVKLLVEVTKENQTRKILEMVCECENLEEAKEKIRALLEK